MDEHVANLQQAVAQLQAIAIETNVLLCDLMNRVAALEALDRKACGSGPTRKDVAG